jgi:hypothetical protein
MATQGYKMSVAARDLNNADILHTTRNGVKALVFMMRKIRGLDGSQINLDKPPTWRDTIGSAPNC